MRFLGSWRRWRTSLAESMGAKRKMVSFILGMLAFVMA